MTEETQAKQAVLHYGIAERGKLYSLEGRYRDALRYYREAIKLAQRGPNGEIFFQHYSQCVMEALELSGSHREVISYCENFIGFLEAKDLESDLVKKHYSTALERQAIQYLYLEDRDEAAGLLKQAQDTAGRGRQPLTDDLLLWLQRGYQVSKKQVKDAQLKHRYFIVRKDNVKPECAVELPEGINPF